MRWRKYSDLLFIWVIAFWNAHTRTVTKQMDKADAELDEEEENKNRRRIENGNDQTETSLCKFHWPQSHFQHLLFHRFVCSLLSSHLHSLCRSSLCHFAFLFFSCERWLSFIARQRHGNYSLVSDMLCILWSPDEQSTSTASMKSRKNVQKEQEKEKRCHFAHSENERTSPQFAFDVSDVCVFFFFFTFPFVFSFNFLSFILFFLFVERTNAIAF